MPTASATTGDFEPDAADRQASLLFSQRIAFTEPLRYKARMKPEYLALVFMVLIALLMWRFFLWVKEGPVTPDPWAKDDDDAVKQPDAVPLCPRCLSPQEEDCRFCAACGSATGLYNNWNPYLYIFSMGEVLRLGTSGSIKTNFVTVLGYLLLSLAQYTVFVPVYWVFFFRNVSRIQHEAMTSQAQKSVP